MPWLVQTDLARARDLELRDATPALVLDRRREPGALSLEFLDRLLEVVAHEEQGMMPRLSAPTRAGMHSKLGRRQREDQPAGAGVHGIEAQDVAQERAGSLGVLGKDDRVHPSDHAGILAWDESVASTVVGLAPCSGI
jgi:hypothetical protein